MGYRILLIVAGLNLALRASPWCDTTATVHAALPQHRGHDLVYVTNGGLRPRKSQGVPVPPGRRFDFLEAFFVAAASKDGKPWTAKDAQGNQYHLLVRTDETGETITEYVGWTDRRFLLMDRESLRDDATGIHRKAMIVNRWREGDLLDEEVPVRHAPDESSPQVDTVRLFGLYFIFAEANGFVLLGSQPTFPHGLPQDVVLGWVPASRICRWNTRQALDWNTESTQPTSRPRRTKPGVIWSCPAAAAQHPPDAAYDGSQSVDDEDILFREMFDEDGISHPRPFEMMRFPMLEITPQLRQVGRMAPGGWELDHIGAVGDFVNEDGIVIRTAEQINEYQRFLNNIEQQMTCTEVLFVIDDTEGMDRWFLAAAHAVEAILDRISREQVGELRLAVAFYNDRWPNPDDLPYETMPLQWARAGGRQVIEILEDKRPQGGGPPRNHVFDGIRAAIDDARFGRHARKLVVVLGRTGDKSNENDPAPAEKLVEKLFPPNESPIEFYALHTQPRERIDRFPDFRAFEVQMQRIVGLAKAKAAVEELHYRAEYDLIQREARLTELIAARYEEMQEQIAETGRMIAALRRGSAVAAISPDLERRIREAGHPIDELRKGGRQVFQEGFVWFRKFGRGHHPGGPPSPLRLKLLLNDRELETIIRCLQRWVFEEVHDENAFDELRRQAINAMAGELGVRDGCTDEVRRRLTGLNVRSPILLGELPPAPQAHWQQVYDLHHVRNVLEDIRNNQRSEYKSVKRDIGGVAVNEWVKVGEMTEDHRGFHLAGAPGIRWYWIDQDTEWP